MDAGGGEFYVRGNGEAKDGGEAVLTRDEFVAVLAEAQGTVCVCEARVAEALVEFATVVVEEPVAADAFTLAEAAFAAGDFADVAALDANYLRRADAEMLEKQRAAMAARRAEARLFGWQGWRMWTPLLRSNIPRRRRRTGALQSMR